jgi:rRNA maturation protein Nop10
MVAGVVSRNWINNMRLRAATNFERPFGNYIVEHKNGYTHRSTERCPLCQEAAKNAAPQFSSVDDVFVRHGNG